MRRPRSRSACPMAERRTARVVRSNRRTRQLFASAPIAALTAAGEMPSARAAPEKDRRSAAATKISMWRSRSIVQKFHKELQRKRQLFALRTRPRSCGKKEMKLMRSGFLMLAATALASLAATAAPGQASERGSAAQVGKSAIGPEDQQIGRANV